MFPVTPGHKVIAPPILPGVDGVPAPTVTANVLALLVPHAFDAVTLILPLSPVFPVVTVIEVVP